MNTGLHVTVVIILMGFVSLFLRAFPFLFMEFFKTYKIISYLGTNLPAVVMLILVIYSLKDLSISTYPFGLPQLMGVSVVGIAHFLKRNVLLSIFSGTFVFAVIQHFLLLQTI